MDNVKFGWLGWGAANSSLLKPITLSREKGPCRPYTFDFQLLVKCSNIIHLDIMKMCFHWLWISTKSKIFNDSNLLQFLFTSRKLESIKLDRKLLWPAFYKTDAVNCQLRDINFELKHTGGCAFNNLKLHHLLRNWQLITLNKYLKVVDSLSSSLPSLKPTLRLTSSTMTTPPALREFYFTMQLCAVFFLFFFKKRTIMLSPKTGLWIWMSSRLVRFYGYKTATLFCSLY